MVLEAAARPLVGRTLDVPEPAPGQVRLRVCACGVCRTDLHIVDGELPAPALPLVPGHEIVGRVDAVGAGTRFHVGDRVGVPWLGATCGACSFCASGAENLCDSPRFTGYHCNGGYAEYTLADARYCFALPDTLDDLHAAPLLCAGLIGYRALRFAPDARDLGLYGYGAAAHLLTQIAIAQGRRVHAFTRAGDVASQHFARSLGCVWAGDAATPPARPLDAALIFAPAGDLVPIALRAVRKGGTVVCAGIHMSDIPSFGYDLLWGERRVCSVANLTRADGAAFFELAARTPLTTHIEVFDLAQANAALDAVRGGRIQGAAVLRIA
jgi:propanol-preferring alcohol dehydrogenase